jgi:hypothetical protein
MVILEFDGRTLQVELNAGSAARQLAAALPQALSMSRWGDEYYGTLAVPVSSGEKRRDVFEVGEVALWPEGNAFCIFFGPTPVSRGSEPRMASPGIALGRIVSDVSVLVPLGPRVRMTLKRGADGIG